VCHGTRVHVRVWCRGTGACVCVCHGAGVCVCVMQHMCELPRHMCVGVLWDSFVCVQWDRGVCVCHVTIVCRGTRVCVFVV